MDLPNVTLVYMQKGEDVKKVQLALNKLGYKISTDGSYGPATRNAVLSFQKKYSSLDNDGSYGPKTRAVMLKALKDLEGDTPPSGRFSTEEMQTRGLVFSSNKSSDQIRYLKDFFRALGKSSVPSGYNYDSKTINLVKDYQRSKGLAVDGVAGPLTMAKINKDIRDKNLKIGLIKPHIKSTGDMIIINKSSNTLYFFKNKVIQNIYPVATGKTPSLTPTGRFTIVVKHKNPYWGGAGLHDPIAGGAPNNPLGKRWLGISLRGGGVYGVHGNAAHSSIGTYASLGCVRMFNKDVESLYEKIKIGTPIWIGNESSLEGYGVVFK